MERIVDEIRAIEFERIRYDQESDAYFDFEKGEIPVLISAPHGAKHFRKGRWKEEDEYTAAIAIQLAHVTGAHVMYVRNRTVEDSNYIRKTKYKDKLKDVIETFRIEFLLDIHGANKNKPFKVCVGTRYDNPERSSCPRFKGIIEEVFHDFQEPPIFNRRHYMARKWQTVTSFARKECGIDAAQIEINARYRIVERKPDSTKALMGEEPFFEARGEDVLALFDRLTELILRIKKKIEAGRQEKLRL